MLGCLREEFSDERVQVRERLQKHPLNPPRDFLTRLRSKFEKVSSVAAIVLIPYWEGEFVRQIVQRK